MPPSITCEVLLGYTGSKPVMLSSNELVYCEACSLVVLDVSDSTRSYIDVGTDRPVGAVAASLKVGLLAVTSKTESCTLTTFTLPGYRKSQTVQNVGTMDCSLAFSRDGAMLGVAGSLPSFTVTLFTVNASTKSLTQFCRTTAAAQQPKQLFFSPFSREEAASVGNGHVAFWKIDKTQGAPALVATEGKAPSPIKVTALCYATVNGAALCGTAGGDIYQFDTTSGSGVAWWENPGGSTSPVVSILLTRHHLVCTSSDGVVKFFSHSNHAIERTVTLVSTKVAHVLLSPLYNQFFACGADGVIQAVLFHGYDRSDLTPDAFREIPDAGRCITDFSGSAFTGVAHLDPSVTVDALGLVATVGDDRTLRLWAYDANMLVAKVDCGKKPACVAAGRGDRSNLVFVGSATGHVRAFDVADPHRPKLVASEKLSESGHVTNLRVTPDGRWLACIVDMPMDPALVAAAPPQVPGSTTTTSSIFFASLTEAGNPVSVLGQLPCEAVVKDACWYETEADTDGPNAGILFAATEASDVRMIAAPIFDASDTGHEFSKSIVVHSWRLDLPAERLVVTGDTDDCFQLAVCSRDKGVKLYAVEKPGKQADAAKVFVKKPAVQWKPNARLGVAMAVVNDWIVTATMDGRIEIRDVKGKNGEDALATVCKHNCLMGGIAGMCVSPDGKRATTVGRDGLFGVWALGSEPRRDVPLQDVPFRIADQDELVQVKEEEAVYTVKAERQHLAALRAQHGDHRAQVIDRISQLRDALQHFKLENSEAAAEEKLETQAFMLASQREAIEELGRQKMAEKEEDIKWCNLAKDYVAHNLKRDNYDAMDAHLLVLHGLTGAQQPKVPSYTIRKVSHKEKVILRKLKFLREVEIAEWNRRKNFEGLDNLVADPPPAEEEDAEAAEEKDPDAVEEDEPETADPTLDEEATLPVDHLLYNKYMSYTRSRAVTQMTLFQQQISVLRRAFNEKIVEGLDRKKTDLSRIAEKYVRVKQIRKELDLPDEDPPSYYVAAEHPERVLLVEDAEIEALASATRQAIIALDAAEQDGALKNTSADNDEKETNEKALKVMMDNRLERDERTVAEIKVPSFADPENKDYKPTEEWTDDEQRLFKEYEKKLQKRQEEEDKRCRLLQGELKDTLREVAKICDDHADFLVKLYDTKLNVDAEVGKLDVQIIKLAQSLVQEEEMAKHYQRLVTVVSEVRDETSHAVHLAQEAQRELQTKRDRWEDLLANEKKKTGDKEIRQQPPFSEAEEYAETLIKLLKKSTRPRRDKAAKANREDRDRKQLIDASPDPFSFLEEDEDDAKKPKQPVATDTVSDFKLDKPEGLRDDLWKEFLDFRRERLEYEKEQKILYDALQELAKVTDTLTRESRAQQDKLAERVQLLHDFKRQMIKESYNLDVLYTFKQGKIEVEQEAVVTDYADGILIRKELIEALNEQIREHGRAKVDKMREIVEFKKNIRSIEWENRMLQHEVDVCEMEYKHLHTLRVTKAMQEFIKGGSESHHDLERSSILKKIDHVRASMAAKIEEKRQATLKVKRIVKDREAENAALEEQVKAARQIVCQREDITRLQSTGLDHQRNLKLMKDVRVTRKLEDVAKAQQEEMKLLKKEVDRLREATFPSFAVVSKRVVGNPDEL